MDSEASTSAETHIICSSCELQAIAPQIFSCRSCDLSSLCEICVNVHLRKKHDVVDSSGYHPGVCSHHSSISTYYCKTCTSSLCAVCFPSHVAHEYRTISDQATRIRRQIHESITKCESMVKPIVNQKIVLDDTIADLKKIHSDKSDPFNIEDCKKIIMDVVDEFHENYKTNQEHWLLHVTKELDERERASSSGDNHLRALRDQLVASDGVLVDKYVYTDVCGELSGYCNSQVAVATSMRKNRHNVGSLKDRLRGILARQFPEECPPEIWDMHRVKVLQWDKHKKICYSYDYHLVWEPDARDYSVFLTSNQNVNMKTGSTGKTPMSIISHRGDFVGYFSVRGGLRVELRHFNICSSSSLLSSHKKGSFVIKEVANFRVPEPASALIGVSDDKVALRCEEVINAYLWKDGDKYQVSLSLAYSLSVRDGVKCLKSISLYSKDIVFGVVRQGNLDIHTLRDSASECSVQTFDVSIFGDFTHCCLMTDEGRSEAVAAAFYLKSTNFIIIAALQECLVVPICKIRLQATPDIEVVAVDFVSSSLTLIITFDDGSFIRFPEFKVSTWMDDTA